MAHLSDEQMTELIDGTETAETRAHIASCRACADELDRLRNVIQVYAIRTTVQARKSEQRHALRIHRPARFGIRSLGWVAAGLLLVCMVDSDSWLHHVRNADVNLASAGNVTHSVEPKHSESGATVHTTKPHAISDDELLEAVNADLSRDMPIALQPVSTITVARNDVAAQMSSTSSQGESR